MKKNLILSTNIKLVKSVKPKHKEYNKDMIDWTHIFRDYKGLWVAIEGKNTVVASGKTPLLVRDEAIKGNHKNTSLFYVPKREGHFAGTTL